MEQKKPPAEGMNDIKAALTYIKIRKTRHCYNSNTIRLLHNTLVIMKKKQRNKTKIKLNRFLNIFRVFTKEVRPNSRN